jgi:hypothetical protein
MRCREGTGKEGRNTMARDEAQICNTALSRIGVTTKITSLDNPRTKEAIELAQVYEEVRDRVLAAAHWPFARKSVRLQQSGETPEKWAYRYEYPNDCLAVRFIFPPIGAGRSPQSFRQSLQEIKTPYEIALSEDDSLTLCTDLGPEAVLEYTKRVTNPARFDALFASALAWALAAEVALPLAKTVDYAQNAIKAYDLVVAQATAKALNEEVRQDPPDSEFVRARL